MKTKIATIVVIALLVVVNFSIWSYVNNPLQLRPWTKTTMGLTYDPMREHDTKNNNQYPTVDDMNRDLALLNNKVDAIRTYTVLKEQDKIPELISKNKYQMNVSVGAWIDGDLEKNRQEIDALIRISKPDDPSISRIRRLIVGNEVMLRKDITEEALINYIREVKKVKFEELAKFNEGKKDKDKRKAIPVSTAETWDMWKAHPNLVKEVDFIAVHILPYWEGIDVADAVDYVFFRYNELKQKYPDKSIVITEAGWPSDGQPFKHAIASISNQARFLREFLNRVDEFNQVHPREDEKIKYYIVEAFDQPWKKSIEGSAGAYWGLFKANRQAKYPLDGDVIVLPGWRNWAAGAAVFSVVLMGLFTFTRTTLQLPGLVFFGLIANLAASVIFWSASIGAQQYQTELSLFFWGLMILMQIMAAIILLIESLEIAEVVWHKKSVRSFQPLTPPPDFRYPKVSLHLPIHNEPPLMVRKTLEALAKVDYPNLEVLVMDNNTKDPAVWEPVREDCERLGSMFRFFHLENWPGFKAGAINHALEQTAPDAEIIAVIDSDYVLQPDWLKCMVPYFDNDNVGFVQSPQDYRDRHQSTFKSFCYWEYAGFFNIGMVQRNEYNAIIQHGTMTMIRKSALLEVGKWAEWCICEDSELGLRLYEAGYDSVYVKDSFGRGLMPDTFSGYMTQRFRWVYGAMQIIKGHWRSFLPTKKSPLTAAQRYYFLAGWLPWFSDALALVFTAASLVLTAIILYDPIHSELPSNVFLMPTIGVFSFKILRGLWLYQARVPCSVWQSLGAALTGLSLTHTVAQGTIQGLFTSGKPFMRTPKYEKQGPLFSGLRTIQQELLLLILLSYGIYSMCSLEHFDNLSGKLWIAILSVQLVPYVATLLTILISVAPSYGRKSKLLAEEMDE